MPRTANAPLTIGQDQSLLGFATRRFPTKPSMDVVSRFRQALSGGTVADIDRAIGIRGIRRQVLIAEGVTTHQSESYLISVRRGVKGNLFALAQQIQFGELGPLVRDFVLLDTLIHHFISTRIHETVCELMESRRIPPDLCPGIRDELIEDTENMIRHGVKDDINSAASQALEDLLDMPGSLADALESVRLRCAANG